jgi:hypothetical protein
MFTLENNGDDLGKKCWDSFIKDKFPNYQKFWQKFVINLTNRSNDQNNIHLQTSIELSLKGKTDEDVCLGQLNYTTLQHLSRCYDIINNEQVTLDKLMEGFSRLVASHDTAFELLERFNNAGVYKVWDWKESKKATKNWRKSKGQSLQYIEFYRNRLMHGMIIPTMIGAEGFAFPKIGMQDKYLDWRNATNQDLQTITNLTNDFMEGSKILNKAWGETIDYLNTEFRKIV